MVAVAVAGSTAAVARRRAYSSMMRTLTFRLYRDRFELLDAQALGAPHQDWPTLEQARRFAASLLPRSTVYLIVPVVDRAERREDVLRERTPDAPR